MLRLFSEFVVLGTPVGKGRPRFARRGAFVSTYTPAKTRCFEDMVKSAYTLKEGSRRSEKPIELRLTAFFPLPKHCTKQRLKEIEDSGWMYRGKPDIDNLAKAIMDGLQGAAYDDDCQIVRICATKVYAQPCSEPRTEVAIFECDC